MNDRIKQRAIILACIGTLLSMCGVLCILLSVASLWIAPTGVGWMELIVMGGALLWFGRKLTRPLIAYYKMPHEAMSPRTDRAAEAPPDSRSGDEAPDAPS